MSRRPLIDRLDDEIGRIQEEADERKRDLVRPHIQAEFERVRQKCPALKSILFGNGTFLLDGIQDKIAWSYPYPQGNHYVQDNLTPKYLYRLIILCSMVERIGLDDVFPLEDAA